MPHVDPADPHDDCLHLPRAAVRFPVTWQPADGFRPDDLATWPALDGRLEYTDRRIQYMPPCGEEQQEVAADVTAALHAWVRDHAGFIVGSNEAGMLLGGEVRAADAAVWRASGAGKSRGLRRVPPLLAVEISGQDEDEAALRQKAEWYLAHGVEIVWLVMTEAREVIAITPAGEARVPRGAQLPEHGSLPGLTPEVGAFFFQIDRRG